MAAHGLYCRNDGFSARVPQSACQRNTENTESQLFALFRKFVELRRVPASSNIAGRHIRTKLASRGTQSGYHWRNHLSQQKRTLARSSSGGGGYSRLRDWFDDIAYKCLNQHSPLGEYCCPCLLVEIEQAGRQASHPTTPQDGSRRRLCGELSYRIPKEVFAWGGHITRIQQ